MNKPGHKSGKMNGAQLLARFLLDCILFSRDNGGPQDTELSFRAAEWLAPVANSVAVAQRPSDPSGDTQS